MVRHWCGAIGNLLPLVLVLGMRPRLRLLTRLGLLPGLRLLLSNLRLLARLWLLTGLRLLPRLGLLPLTLTLALALALDHRALLHLGILLTHRWSLTRSILRSSLQRRRLLLLRLSKTEQSRLGLLRLGLARSGLSCGLALEEFGYRGGARLLHGAASDCTGLRRLLLLRRASHALWTTHVLLLLLHRLAR